MSEQTSNLNLPLPLENDNVSRQFFVDLIQKIDDNALSEKQLKEAIAEIAVELTQDYNSTDQDTAISADAVRRGLETKQNTVRLADNYLAASVLVNASPDAQGRAYPDGISLFKVSSSSGGWPTANGYVVTMHAGSSGFQFYFEIYTGNVQAEKTNRFWYRSKRDANSFWQEWNRVATETDLMLKVDANRPSNLIPNGSGEWALIGWRVTGGINAWAAGKGSAHAVGEFAYTGATDQYFGLLESDRYTAAPGVYNISAEFFVGTGQTAGHSIEVLSFNSSGTGSLIGSVVANNGDFWTRRGQNITLPAGTVSFSIRLVAHPNRPSTYRGFRKIQLTVGAGMTEWNNDSVSIIPYQFSYLTNRGLELGLHTSGDGPAYVDFHTSAVGTDYNARIIASNDTGKGGIGQGQITVNALGGVFTDGPLYVQGTDLKKSVSDGKAVVRAAITAKGGTVGDADGDGIPTHAEIAAGVNSIGTGGFIDSTFTRQGPVFVEVNYTIANLPPIKNAVAITPRQGSTNFGSFSSSSLLYLVQGINVVRLPNGEGGTAITINAKTKTATIYSSYSGQVQTVSASVIDFNQPSSLAYRTDTNYGNASQYFLAYITYS